MDKLTTESLPVKLTQDEIREFGVRNAREVKEIVALQDEKKSVAADFKERIEKKESDLKYRSECINSKVEYRQVSVHESIDRSKGIATLYRDDTQEVVRTRNLTPREMQMELEMMSEPLEQST